MVSCLVSTRALRHLALITLVASTLPRWVDAQERTRTGSVAPNPAVGSGFMGIVYDSVRGGPLAGAIIGVIGTTRRVTTDARGQYRIDSIPAGRYRLLLSHPLLDTLALEITSPPVDLPDSHYVLVALAIPSAATIRQVVCSGGINTKIPSLFMGRVRDADTGEPAAGAHVTLVYSEITASRDSGFHQAPRVRRNTAGADGSYTTCGLSPTLRGSLQAERSGVKTAEVDVGFGPESGILALRILTVGRPNVMRASVTGRVLDSLGAPVVGAQVALAGAEPTTATGQGGDFRLDALPSGTLELVVRRIGFAPTSRVIDLSERETSRVTVELQTVRVTLPQVRVGGRAESGLDLVGFSDRKKAGNGHFIGPAEIERARARQFTDLLNGVPGFTITETFGGKSISATRAVPGQATACVTVFVDRAPWQSLQAGDLDGAFPVSDVAAIETYSGIEVPSEFSVPGRSCSTIVVWTRTKVERP